MKVGITIAVASLVALAFGLSPVFALIAVQFGKAARLLSGA